MLLGVIKRGVLLIGVDTWTVAEAKAKFSEVIERARSTGPQTVTRNGRAAVIVVAPDEWERKTRRSGNLAEFLGGSPLKRRRFHDVREISFDPWTNAVFTK